MKDLLTHLADKNGLSEELYAQNVRQGAREEYPFADDEIAIIRKELAYLRGIVETLLGEKLPPSEFTAYNDKIEGVKALIKSGGREND